MSLPPSRPSLRRSRPSTRTRCPEHAHLLQLVSSNAIFHSQLLRLTSRGLCLLLDTCLRPETLDTQAVSRAASVAKATRSVDAAGLFFEGVRPTETAPCQISSALGPCSHDPRRCRPSLCPLFSTISTFTRHSHGNYSEGITGHDREHIRRLQLSHGPICLVDAASVILSAGL